jgi:FkbM family methyltransferase
MLRSRAVLSDDGESWMVRDYLGPREGYFVDVGANRPQEQSQTFHLEQRGWSGVLIEPQPDLAAELLRCRTAQVYAVACSSPNNAGRSMPLQVAGVFSTLNAEMLDLRATPSDIIGVAVRTLDQVLIDAQAPSPIDFLSIDVEGHELDVVRGFDFERWRPRLILIEDHVVNRRLHDYLVSRGYRWMRRTGLNSWYVPTRDARPLGLYGRWQFVRKYHLALPVRRLRQEWRRVRRRLGLMRPRGHSE